MHRASRHIRRAPGRRTARESGQAMVEFALVVPILLMLLFAGIEFGDAFWKWQQLSGATSEGARRAAVSRTASDRETRVRTTVRESAPNLTASQVTVTISSSWSPGDQVTVTASYPETIRIFGVPVWSGNLTSTRVQRVEQ